MTTRILKFVLPTWGPAEIRTGGIARWLAVGWQALHPVVWVEAVEGDGAVNGVYVALTGETPTPDAEYVGTVQATDAPVHSYVVHVYRRLS